MTYEDEQVPPADAGRIEAPVRPDAWWARAENGNIRAWTSAHAESLRLADEVGFQLEPLYSLAALDAAVAAERERWQKWACRKEWDNVNDPPCHPSDKGWRPCDACEGPND